MKIKETYAGFTNSIHIGKFAFFIVVDKLGIELELNNLVEQAVHFNYVVIKGEEPFRQKKDIGDLIKKIHKNNPETEIEIHTKGTIKPIGIQSMDNLNFIVNLQLKNAKKSYEERIKVNELLWFMGVNTKFVFDIKQEEDIDETLMLMIDLDIKKKSVYLYIDTNEVNLIKHIKNKAKIHGVNYAFNFDKILEVQNE